MTLASDSKPVRRETWGTYRGRALIVELGARTVTIRQKGCRLRYEVDYEAIWSLGAKKEAERKRLEKRKKKGLHQ